MHHCCQFKADDIYYLEENSICTSRILSVGFCPACGKPVAELVELNFAGGVNRVTAVGINAHNLLQSIKNEILYSYKEVNYRKFKSKPYGWKYGLNKVGKNGKLRQYACDFYGNKELIKSF